MSEFGIPRWFQGKRKWLRCCNSWHQVQVKFGKFCVKVNFFFFCRTFLGLHCDAMCCNSPKSVFTMYCSSNLLDFGNLSSLEHLEGPCFHQKRLFIKSYSALRYTKLILLWALKNVKPVLAPLIPYLLSHQHHQTLCIVNPTSFHLVDIWNEQQM